MMRHVFFFLFALAALISPMRGEETPFPPGTLKIKETLKTSQPGSFVVLQQNKTFTFLHIFDRSNDQLILEEVSIPEDMFRRKNMSWKEWFERGGPGSSTWIMSKINLATGQVEQAYSFKHEGWLDVSQIDHFMSTLLNLSFEQASVNKRRRLGPLPKYEGPDTRPFWNPRVVVDGNVVPDVPFSTWVTTWPRDGSEMAHKVIEIYMPLPISTPTIYPTYFPYWVEVEGKVSSIRMRVVDSGLYAQSPKQAIFK